MTTQEETIETFEFVEDGIIENPVYDSHKRAKNWAAVLEGRNSVNLELIFLKTRGKKVDATSLQVGQAIEFGGDYISGGGRRHPDRVQYVIEDISEKHIVMKQYPTRAQAMKHRFKREEQQQ